MTYILILNLCISIPIMPVQSQPLPNSVDSPASQYRQHLLESIMDEYGYIGEYLQNVADALHSIPDPVIEYCMADIHDPDEDSNHLHNLVSECPENIISAIIEQDEYSENELNTDYFRNVIGMCLYIMYKIASNIPNHPHRNSNWLQFIQRYSQNGDIHLVMSNIVNNAQDRIHDTSDNTDEENEQEDTNILNEAFISETFSDDDTDANQNLPEDLQNLFNSNNFYDYIMQGIDLQQS